MKNLILILGLTVSTLVSYSQKLVVEVDTIQEISWPLNVTLIEAEKNNLVKYERLGVGHGIYTFNIKEKSFTLIGDDNILKKFNIINYSKNGDSYNFEVKNKKYVTKLTITEQIDGGYLLAVMFDFSEGDLFSEGYFSKNIKLRKN